MPIYEFECEDENCKSTVEVQVDMGVDSWNCPECKKPMKKLISAANWNLKGDGWYRTTPPAPCKPQGGG